jgi:hypothetical protein
MKKLEAISAACHQHAASRLLRICRSPQLPAGSEALRQRPVQRVTPAVYRIKHAQIDDPQRVRLEADGYQLYEGVLSTRICRGRIVSDVFTLGSVLLIRGPTRL